MYRLNLPPYEIKVSTDNGRRVIWDMLRRKYVVLTPEEWVRQHFIHYLIDCKGYPSALLANEVELSCGTKKLRCDSVLYDKNAIPHLIIEYKAPNIPITQKTFDQISVYNFLLKVDYLIVSNGLQHYCCMMDYANNRCVLLKDIPEYADIKR